AAPTEVRLADWSAALAVSLMSRTCCPRCGLMRSTGAMTIRRARRMRSTFAMPSDASALRRLLDRSLGREPRQGEPSACGVVAGGSSTLEQWVEDALAVMDGAGVARYRPSEEPSNKAPFCHDDFEVDLFVRMNNTGGPADVWA